MSLEEVKRSVGNIVERAKDLVGDIKGDLETRKRIKKEMATPADLGDIDAVLVDIFNDLFPQIGFTEENIKGLVSQAGLTEFDYNDILETSAWGGKVLFSTQEKIAALKGSMPEAQK